MLRKIARPMLTALIAASLAAASVQSVQARGGARAAAGIAAGIIGLGLLGAYAHAHDPHYRDYYYDDGPECYRGPERCRWVGRRCFYNDYGDYICRGGRYTCIRDNYCD